MSEARRTEGCAICGASDLEPVLDLGSSPPTCLMPRNRVAETSYPLVLLRCRSCGFVALSVAPPPEEVFPEDYPYSSGNSPALREHFAALAHEISPGPNGLIIDIGANDGTLLSQFGCRRIGIEPTGQGRGIEGIWVQKSLTVSLAQQLVAQYGQADVITACNVLAHVPSINEAMSAIRVLLADDGILVAECHDLKAVAEGQWDAVYHEHLRYFDPHTFERLLNAHDLGLRYVERVDTHGGSFRAIAEHGFERAVAVPWDYDFEGLRHQARRDRDELREFCLDRGPVIGVGATARATTMINYAGLDREDVMAIAEVPGSDKIGRLIPGTRIPILDEREIDWGRDAILFSWHLADAIVPAWRRRNYTGEFHIPIQGVGVAV